MSKKNSKHSSSFRDPGGFVFYQEGKIFRQINNLCQKDFDYLISSGLYKTLTKGGLLIPHKEVSKSHVLSPTAYRIIQPEVIPFISYPYEWCFGQLKSAALLTLKVQKIALEHGMSLKDASAYNIQFRGYKPVFIDTLSFAVYEEEKPWVAYKQFCQHFLAPLALMAYTDVRLNQMLKIYVGGIPLSLAANLLPLGSKLNFGLLAHLHLHSASQEHYADKNLNLKKYHLKKNRLVALISSLEKTIKNLKLKKINTEWENYYSFTNYSDKSFKNKAAIVSKYLATARPKTVWDLGANTGEFSRLAKEKAYVISCDIDPLAVEINFERTKKNKERSILPLILDLTNPSPALGWANKERGSFSQRGPVDLILALALIHHLAISDNLPLNYIAEYFSRLGSNLIIEFIPKDDSKAQKLLSTREDIFPYYDKGNFEKEFSKYFRILKSEKIKGAKRTIYLMKKRKPNVK